MSRRFRILVTVFILGGALLIAFLLGSGPRRAAGQPPLADISSIETLRSQFNRDSGKTRLVLLGSPT